MKQGQVRKLFDIFRNINYLYFENISYVMVKYCIDEMLFLSLNCTFKR